MSGLVATIEAAALTTLGVVGLYRTGSAVANMIGAAAEQLTAEAATRAAVTEMDEGIEVELTVGIVSAGGAVATVQAVHDRVREARPTAVRCSSASRSSTSLTNADGRG